MTPVSAARTAGDAGSNQFAIHVVQIHAHHTITNKKAARPTAATVRSSRIRCDSCVIAKT